MRLPLKKVRQPLEVGLPLEMKQPLGLMLPPNVRLPLGVDVSFSVRLPLEARLWLRLPVDVRPPKKVMLS